MCLTPKMLFIKHPDTGVRHRIFVPCGKCSDCQNSKRAECVLRIRQEYKDTIRLGGSVWFVTLHYSNQNLVYYKRGFSEQKLKRLKDIARMRAENGKLYNYRSFVLNKVHLRKFLQSVNQYLKNVRADARCRFYAVGEYGTLQQRPHYHVMLFLPFKMNKRITEDMLKTCWHYGDYDIFDFDIKAAVYLAKHNIKEEIGSIIQQKYSPMFRTMSVYHGSIGRGLFNDKHLISNLDRDVNYTNIDGKYKVAVPRFVRKHHKGNRTLSDFELNEFERQSLSKMSEEFYYEFGKTFTDKEFNYSEFYSLNSTRILKDNEKKIAFHKQYFQKKLLTFVRKTKSKFNNFNFTLYNGKLI